MPAKSNTLPSSFRDPSGFLFTQSGTIYRQVNQSYREDFELLEKSGLARELISRGLLVPFKRKGLAMAQTKEAWDVLEPVNVPFISYPYEWSFSQLQDAALVTLAIQKVALEHGMSLKDASAYNIQFLNGKPVLIDTLSFEKFEEEPWVAYRQFCQHFLAPLALASYTDIRLTQLLRVHIDGIPLDLAAKLLPVKAKLKPGLLTNIILHAKSQNMFADRGATSQAQRELKLRKGQLLAIINGLEGAVRGLTWQPQGTEWGNYYQNTNYSNKSFKEKAEIVDKFIRRARPRVVWDLGGNIGEFSRVAAKKANLVISADVDPAAVELNYRQVKAEGEKKILPLVLDLTNPSGGLGWGNSERMSFGERGPADTVLALALIHHLAISNNLPFSKIAQFMAKSCKDYLIIEFVPKSDSQVKRLLATREDIFSNYSEEGFEDNFGKLFTIAEKAAVKGSKRTIYLLKKKNG